MTNEYPKAFKSWYRLHINYNYKQSCYNAWKAGRKYQKKLATGKVTGKTNGPL